MPYTSLSFPVASGDQLADIAWADEMHVETQDELWFTQQGMTAKDTGGELAHERRSGLPIILRDDLKRKAGEEVRLKMRRQLTNAPRTTSTTYGTGSMLGSEEAMVFLDVSVFLSLLKNAVGYNSPDLNYHRTSIDMEANAEDALKEWLVEHHEESILDAFYDGHPYQTVQSISSVSTINHPNIYRAGGVSGDDDLTTSSILNAQEARRMRSYFVNRRLNPIRIDGGRYGVVLADTFVCNDLKGDSEFREQQASNDRGQENPLISGSIGTYQNLCFHEYERMRRTTSGANSGNVGRLALLGADAIAVAYGSEPRLVPRIETAYGDRWGRAIRQVFGARRAEFQNQANTVTVQQSSAEWRVWEDRDEFAQ